MDAPLALVTLLSLMMAITMLGITWRVLREERRRSAARVAVLAARIEADSDEAAPETEREQDAVEAGPATAEPGSLFGAAERTHGRSPRPVTIIAIGVLVVAGLGATALMLDYGVRPDRIMSLARREPAASLELTSLRHTRQADRMLIAGLVRNPAAGAQVSGITAVAFLFDRGGSFLASGRAPLDFSTLGPGEESPFEIIIPHAGHAGRYRVSFRTEAGVVPHVDGRGEMGK